MPLDNGKIYAVWGYRNLKLAELKPDLSGIVPGNERELFPKDSQMGEGSHRYKIGDQYFILSAWSDGRMRMPAARAKNILGPWEVNPAISADEDFGLAPGNRLVNDRSKTDFTLKPHDPAQIGRMSMHQPPGPGRHPHAGTVKYIRPARQSAPSADGTGAATDSRPAARRSSQNSGGIGLRNSAIVSAQRAALPMPGRTEATAG